jgi:hypothetical protein
MPAYSNKIRSFSLSCQEYIGSSSFVFLFFRLIFMHARMAITFMVTNVTGKKVMYDLNEVYDLTLIITTGIVGIIQTVPA